MTKSELIRAFALEAEGCAYIWGATGQKCTPSYRRARIEQYPKQEKNIKGNCPVLSGKQSSCDGCKYNGRKAYDCAQLTRYSAKAAGLELPSGASSQWNKGNWAEQGTVDKLPRGRVCFLYREDVDANPMGHTGVYLGDGTVAHAKNHSVGTLHEAVENAQWTHWAILRGMENDAPISEYKEQEATEMYKYKVTGNNLALRAMRSTSSAVLVRMPTGTVIEGSPADDTWVKITYGGKIGYSMLKFLQAIATDKEESTPVEPEAELTDKEKLDRLWVWYQQKGAE